MSAVALSTKARFCVAALTGSLYLPLTLWAAALVCCFWAITTYEFSADQPGTGAYATHWPDHSKISRDTGRPSLVLFLHPKCPCSRASLGELERLTESLRGAKRHEAETIVVVTVPESPDKDWLTSDTVARAKKLRNARLFVDVGGVEAQRFGAVTSGSVLVFDAAGTCSYAGGVTMARGHEGDNAGQLAVARILAGEIESAPSIPAFGCRLCLPNAKPDSAAAASLSPSRRRLTAY